MSFCFFSGHKSLGLLRFTESAQISLHFTNLLWRIGFKSSNFNNSMIPWLSETYSFIYYLFCVSPSSPSPVTQQMTAMSISQDSAAVDSDRAEADEGEEESTSSSTGEFYVKQQSFLKPHLFSVWIDMMQLPSSTIRPSEKNMLKLIR